MRLKESNKGLLSIIVLFLKGIMLNQIHLSNNMVLICKNKNHKTEINETSANMLKRYNELTDLIGKNLEE